MALFKLEEADKNWLEAVAKADVAPEGAEALAVAKRVSVAADSDLVAVAIEDDASVLVEASVLEVAEAEAEAL
jgi:hypothetical protein